MNSTVKALTIIGALALASAVLWVLASNQAVIEYRIRDPNLHEWDVPPGNHTVSIRCANTGSGNGEFGVIFS